MTIPRAFTDQGNMNFRYIYYLLSEGVNPSVALCSVYCGEWEACDGSGCLYLPPARSHNCPLIWTRAVRATVAMTLSPGTTPSPTRS
jgi:hypothetical protein